MVIKIAVVLLLLVGLPLVGVMLAGQPLEPYLEFPPRTRLVQHAPFSWPIFAVLASMITLTVGPVILYVAVSRTRVNTHHGPVRPMPWWGWLAAAVIATSWVLAWNRFPWFATLQPHTFTPLWLGYIVLVNAWTFRRTGRCLMVARRGFFLALFPASAAFWWSYEYLNRFVQNWYYLGAQMFTPSEYVLFATVSFSTVLPAVLSTMELLASTPSLSAGLDRLPLVPALTRRSVGCGLLLAAVGGLMGIGLWPDRLFPLVWVAPLLLITGVQLVAGQNTIFSRLASGDGRSLWQAAIAALICGFFWEMWNSKSLAHWEYGIPSVHGFKLFEMPLLGYAGYLPFGLECLAVTSLLFPDHYGGLVTSLARTEAGLGESFMQKAGAGTR